MNRDKEPLYRKHNKTARGFHQNDPGGDFRHERHTKESKNFEGNHKSIKKTQGGFDYTPLFRFLLSKVGKDWTAVHQEAVSRLDKQEPIYWMVAVDGAEKRETVGMGESSRWSGLFVDENNILQKVNDKLSINDFEPSCWCCTHTFNGKPLTKTWAGANHRRNQADVSNI